MDISIILSTFRRPDLLQKTLEGFCSLDTENLKWEVLIVDNADDETTKQVVARFRDRFFLNYLVERKRGKNNALNSAIPEAKGEVCIFTDDDVLPDPGWLIEVWEGSKRWPQYHVFGGKILPKFPERRQLPFEHPFFENAFAIANWDIAEGCYNADKVWGPNMAIRASIFKQGWRFNPDIGPDGTRYYQMGGETELTTRLERAGFRAIYLPRSIVYHRIQTERLSFKWLYERAFSAGREDAYIEIGGNTNPPIVARVPRYLLLRMIKTTLMLVLSKLSRDLRYKFDRGLKYWHTKGMIYQYIRHLHSDR